MGLGEVFWVRMEDMGRGEAAGKEVGVSVLQVMQVAAEGLQVRLVGNGKRGVVEWEVADGQRMVSRKGMGEPAGFPCGKEGAKSGQGGDQGGNVGVLEGDVLIGAGLAEDLEGTEGPVVCREGFRVLESSRGFLQELEEWLEGLGVPMGSIRGERKGEPEGCDEVP